VFAPAKGEEALTTVNNRNISPSSGKSEDQKLKGRKTGWDKASVISQIIGVLAIPIAIAGLLWGVYQFNAQQVQQQQLTRQQEEVTQKQVLDQQRQTTLDTYLDRMSDLLLTYHLSASKPKDVVRAIAQARTYTVVRNLDGARKGTLVRFLLGAGLIGGSQPIMSVSNADLSGAIFTNANLIGANLSGANLIEAKFTNAVLRGAIFTNAVLRRADFSGAELGKANPNPNNNIECSTAPCYPTGANLPGADLSGADLNGATITTEQLKEAKSLHRTTMPDGSIHP
jgi:Pentapeptide repeats (8 copies)